MVEHSVDVEIESLKMQIEIKGEKLIKKINKFIRKNVFQQEKPIRKEKVAFKISDDEILSNQIGIFYPPLYKNKLMSVKIEILIKRICQYLQ
jgi:hypothetical protein